MSNLAQAATKPQTSPQAAAPKQSDGLQDPLVKAVMAKDPLLTKPGFKAATRKGMFARRTGLLARADEGMEDLEKARDDQDVEGIKELGGYLLGLTETWVANHGKDKNSSGGTLNRYQGMEKTRDILKAKGASSGPAGAVSDPDAEGDEVEVQEGKDLVMESLDAVGGVQGVGGDFNDITGKDNFLAKEDGTAFTNAGDGLAGGTGAIAASMGTIYDINEAYQKFKEGEGFEGSQKSAEALQKTSTAVSNAAVFSGAVGAGDDATKTADLSGGIGEIAGGVAAAIETIKGFKDVYATWKQLSIHEKVDFIRDRANNLGAIAQASIKASVGIGKFSGMASTTIAGLASSGAGLGAAIGAIDIASGAGSLVRVSKKKSELKKFRSHLTHLKAMQAKANELGSTAPLAKERAGFKDQAKSIAEIHKLGSGFTERFDKLLTDRAKDDAFKVGTGSLDVVSGVLAATGVGMPVAVGLAAFSTALKLGKAGVQFARDSKARTLIDGARFIRDDGSPTGRPDEKADYNTLEARAEKLYYNNLDKVISDTKPGAVPKEIWGGMVEFVQEEKISRLGKPEKEDHKPLDQKGAVGEKNAWFAHKGKYERAPKGFWGSLKSFFSASARKSSQAKAASQAELADAAVAVAKNAYVRKELKFIDELQVTPSSTSEELENVKSQTAKGMLHALGVYGSFKTNWIESIKSDQKDSGNPVPTEQQIKDQEMSPKAETLSKALIGSIKSMT